MRSPRVRFLLGTLAGVALLAFFFRGVDWSALGQALGSARTLPLAGLIIVIVAAYLLRAWRWGDFLGPMGSVRYLDLFSATMVGFASGLVIPRAGELLRPWLISRRYPIPTSAGFATIILERLVDLIMVLIFFSLYLFALPRPAAQAEGQLTELLKLGGAVAGAGALGVLVFLLALHVNAERIVNGLERLLARAPLWLAGPVGRFLRTFLGGLAVLRAPAPQLAKIGLQSIGIWLLIALAFHLNHLAFSIDLPFHVTFLLMTFLVVGVAIPTPGMVGGFHAFYLIALSEVYGVDRTTAVAAGIAAHALTNLPVLVFGFAFLRREGLSPGRLLQLTRDEKTPRAAP